ncbi:MAG: hypothetical protein LBL39_04220 [Planctomycetaceae bacterium]|jgi:hypothetical protein|nr:hypothetical protein [Planctomycetaceae bacterium]
MKNLTFIFIACTMSLCIVAGIIGCNNSNPQGRIAIDGTVSLNGQPLTQGNVEFISQPNATPSLITGCDIKDGKFTLPAEHGLIDGQTYTVRFRAIEVVSTGQATNEEGIVGQSVVKDLIPPNWGSESKETITAEKGKSLDFKL